MTDRTVVGRTFSGCRGPSAVPGTWGALAVRGATSPRRRRATLRSHTLPAGPKRPNPYPLCGNSVYHVEPGRRLQQPARGAPAISVNTDESLLHRARAFDEQALGEIYDAYFERLYRYAYRFVGDADSAQDVAAETLRRLLEALRDERAPNRLGPWLYRVAYNVAMDQHRRRPVGGLISLEPDLAQADEGDQGADPEADLERRTMEQRVRLAVERLTPEQQNVVVLKFVEGYSNAEVGALLNKPEGAVKSLQHRALAALREGLMGLLLL